MCRQFGIVKLLPMMLLITALTGCTSTLWNRYPPPSPIHAGSVAGATGGAIIGGVTAGAVGAGVGTVVGSILGASFGDIIASHYTIVEELQYKGVQVVQVGDEVKLILPSDRFFTADSSQLNIHYYPVLAKAARFLCNFEKVSMKISGYTDDHGAWQRNLSLSRAQARHLMEYLWRYGIDTRLVYAEGYGGMDPIASNSTVRGRRINRRIEITLRKLEDSDRDTLNRNSHSRDV